MPHPDLTLATLQQIVDEVDAAPGLDAAIGVMVRRVRTALRADVCSVHLSDHDRRELVLIAVDGVDLQVVEADRHDLSRDLPSWVLERAAPLVLENGTRHPRCAAAAEEAPLLGYLGVPIVRPRQRRAVGVLAVQQRLPRKYTEEEASFLVTLATQLAGSLSSAEIRQKLQWLDWDAVAGNVTLDGVASARGVGIGTAVLMDLTLDLETVPDREVAVVEAEVGQFREALAAALRELRQLDQQMAAVLAPGERALLDTYSLLLGGDSLVESTLAHIRQGNWAPGALRATFIEHAALFEAMDEAHFRERSADIRDLGRRLLQRLLPDSAGLRAYPERFVLIGTEIGISDLLEAPLQRLAGLVSVRGAGASHVALLARALGIPAVFGVDRIPLDRVDGCEVVVDGNAAQVCIRPGLELRAGYLSLIQQQAELARGLEKLRPLPAETTNGRRVCLYANSGFINDMAVILASGAAVLRAKVAMP